MASWPYRLPWRCGRGDDCRGRDVVAVGMIGVILTWSCELPWRRGREDGKNIVVVLWMVVVVLMVVALSRPYGLINNHTCILKTE